MAQYKSYLSQNRRLRYGGQVQKGRNIRDIDTLRYFAENEPGNVQMALFQLDLVDYDDDAQIVVKKESTKQAAAAKVKQTQAAAEAPRSYYVKEVQNQAAASGRLISPRTAEQRINRAEAAEAVAILIAARSGGVRLTPAQTERLEKISTGGYLDIVYSQYKSGERGTLAGPKAKQRRAGLDATPAAREDRRRDFYQNVMRRRI
ncbi:MAG: hypothetical protein KF716_14900 [Anaerolineae bacterium]|nr:hypothetical protein [Anaerolineae bacterium]